jgi:hypothetical protein
LMNSDAGRRAPTEPSRISFKRAAVIGLDDPEDIVDVEITEGKKKASKG